MMSLSNCHSANDRRHARTKGIVKLGLNEFAYLCTTLQLLYASCKSFYYSNCTLKKKDFLFFCVTYVYI